MAFDYSRGSISSAAKARNPFSGQIYWAALFPPLEKRLIGHFLEASPLFGCQRWEKLERGGSPVSTPNFRKMHQMCNAIEVVADGRIILSSGEDNSLLGHLQASFWTSNATLTNRENDIQHFITQWVMPLALLGEYYPPWIILSSHQQQARWGRKGKRKMWPPKTCKRDNLLWKLHFLRGRKEMCN